MFVLFHFSVSKMDLHIHLLFFPPDGCGLFQQNKSPCHKLKMVQEWFEKWGPTQNCAGGHIVMPYWCMKPIALTQNNKKQHPYSTQLPHPHTMRYKYNTQIINNCILRAAFNFFT